MHETTVPTTTPTPTAVAAAAAVTKIALASSSLPPSTFTPVTSPELAAAAAATQELDQEASKEVVYKILYFKLHGMAATTRIILALSGAHWESIYPQVTSSRMSFKLNAFCQLPILKNICSPSLFSYPHLNAQDWTNEKHETPFGLMPILYETHSTSGQTLEIPESEAIERYLARKFGFWGKDAWEEIAIHVFYCSSKSVLSSYVNKVLLAFPDTKARELTKFVEKEVPAWIVQHEKWLSRSQNPGFYVGNQVSNSFLVASLSIL